MAHLQFEASLKESVRLEGDVSQNIIPKYPKKRKGLAPLSLLSTHEHSYDKISTPRLTPIGSPNASGLLSVTDTQNRSKSPSRMPAFGIFANPVRKTPLTPHSYADRFIPSRSMTDIDRSHQLLMTSLEANTSELSLKQKEYKDKMSENLNDGQPLADRVLSFKARPPNKEGNANNLKVLYSVSKSCKKSAPARHIPSEPERILDAPELLNDYYLHLLDWSCNNHLSVGLGGSLFIWNSNDGSITSLAKFEEPLYICAVSFITEGNVLAVGLNDGSTELHDVTEQKVIRKMDGHQNRVSSLSWNSYLLSSGCRDGNIVHHDVRMPNHITSTVSYHNQEICGLKWSPDKRHLASGGNDNIVNIWQKGERTPTFTFNDHQAAVKGMAWCPWQSHTLATGGGTADRKIRIWNTSLGTNLQTIETNSQVSSLLWNSHYKELISGHGYAENQLTIWKFPTFTKVIELTGHTERILEMCSCPDSQTVVSAAADETLRIWNCWSIDKKELKKREVIASKRQPVSALKRTIR